MTGNELGTKVKGARGTYLLGNKPTLGPLTAEQAHQRVEVFGKQVLAAQVADDALYFLPTLAVGFYEADVLMLDALAAGGFDRAEVHSQYLSRLIMNDRSIVSRASGDSIKEFLSRRFGPQTTLDPIKSGTFRHGPAPERETCASSPLKKSPYAWRSPAKALRAPPVSGIAAAVRVAPISARGTTGGSTGPGQIRKPAPFRLVGCGRCRSRTAPA
jgi:hypothetical protein